MARTEIKKVGSFEDDVANQINDMFEELYGTQAGGSLAEGKILIGDVDGDAAPQTVSGDGTLDKDGVLDIAAGVTNQKIVTDGLGDAARQVVAGIIALDGTNPTNIALPTNFVVTGYSLTLERSTALSSGTAFVTAGAQSGGNLPIYGWDVDGTASAGTENVAYVIYGYID